LINTVRTMKNPVHQTIEKTFRPVAIPTAAALLLLLFSCAAEREELSCPNECGPTAISAGEAHTCALFYRPRSAGEDEFGQVACWGDNRRGQLGSATGLGVTLDHLPAPVADLEPVRSIAAGPAHTCVSDALRDVYCWGNNTSGQLGDGSTDGAFYPVQVAFKGHNIGSVSAGGANGADAFTCAVDRTGQVWCWGSNRFEVVGKRTMGKLSSDPVSIRGAADMVQVTCGAEHACARTELGEVSCWGGGYGTPMEPTLIEIPIPGDENDPPATVGFAHISAGGFGTCGAAASGDVFCWKAPGEEAERMVTGPAERVAVGRNHACVLTREGTVACWGSNGDGQLGLGHTDSPGEGAEPIPIEGLANVTDISAGEKFTCATSKGRAHCWGRNTRGQLGREKLESAATPHPIRFEDI
jgi:alpha-tubulin suppressor-like RCC1 family protein